jgi:hypothetical protein
VLTGSGIAEYGPGAGEHLLPGGQLSGLDVIGEPGEEAVGVVGAEVTGPSVDPGPGEQPHTNTSSARRYGRTSGLSMSSGSGGHGLGAGGEWGSAYGRRTDTAR